MSTIDDPELERLVHEEAARTGEAPFDRRIPTDAAYERTAALALSDA